MPDFRCTADMYIADRLYPAGDLESPFLAPPCLNACLFHITVYTSFCILQETMSPYGGYSHAPQGGGGTGGKGIQAYRKPDVEGELQQVGRAALRLARIVMQCQVVVNAIAGFDWTGSTSMWAALRRAVPRIHACLGGVVSGCGRLQQVARAALRFAVLPHLCRPIPTASQWSRHSHPAPALLITPP